MRKRYEPIPDFNLEAFHEMLCDSVGYCSTQISMLLPLLQSGILTPEERRSAIYQANAAYCLEILIGGATSSGLISREAMLELTVRRRGTEAAKALEEFFDGEERVWKTLNPEAPAFDLSKMKGPKCD